MRDGTDVLLLGVYIKLLYVPPFVCFFTFLNDISDEIYKLKDVFAEISSCFWFLSQFTSLDDCNVFTAEQISPCFS